MNYGQKITELRKKNNLTQAELGSKLNITAQAISKWENNLSEPDIDSIKRMCELFNVSVDEFLGLSLKAKEEAPTETVEAKTSSSPEPVKVVLAYCEKCKKPVCAGEYKSLFVSYNPSSSDSKVTKSERLHNYCNKCASDLSNIHKEEQRKKQLAKIQAEKDMVKKEMKSGILWASIITVIVAILSICACVNKPETNVIIGAILATIGAFTFTSQMFWDGAVATMMDFFTRSFSAPFGLIFNLSLDGILWFLTVKLALWIICGLLSAAWFIFGFIITLLFSIVSFPFVLGSLIREAR